MQKVFVPAIEVENIETNTIVEEQTEYVENDKTITNVSDDSIETDPIILKELEKEKDDFSNELDEVINYFENIKFTNKITNLTSRRETPSELHDNEFNEEEQYDFEGPEFNELLNKKNYLIKTLPIQNLSIELFTDLIRRFSCACHKNNIADGPSVKMKSF